MSSKIKSFDVILILIPLMILGIGISVIYSLVTNTIDSGLVLKQILSSLIGLTLMVAMSFTDYRFFRAANWIFYCVAILLLIYVDFFGYAAGGAMRWINLGFFQLQPSEIAKAFLIITLGAYFSRKIGKLAFRDLLISLMIFAPLLILVLKEPDLGTALVLCFIYITMLFVSKPGKTLLAVIISGLVIAITIFILAFYNVAPFDKIMHDYQRERIGTFINPNNDPYGDGYHVKQAQIAIGAGGIFGKGLGKGSQSQLQFLPKPQTDFIFSGISEALGFFGAGILLALYCFLIIRILNIAVMAQDNFGMLICCGIAAMIGFQVVVNIGMNLGLAPVTGIPLPFASYGGSALMAYLFMIGLVESIHIRHKKIAF